MKTIKCKYCGNPTPETGIYCCYCGERLARKRKEKNPNEIKAPKPRILSDGRRYGQVMIKGERYPVFGESDQDYYAQVNALRSGIVTRAKTDKRIVRDCIAEYIRAREGKISPATIDGYLRKAKYNLQPLMGLTVGELTKETVQAAIDKDAERYSGKTICEALALLRSATRIELRQEDLVLPSKKPKKKPPVYKTEDLAALIVALADIGGQVECAGLLALWLSLRRSEIKGLRWSDIQGSEIVVSHALVYDKSHKLVEKGGKNETSERRLRCPDYILGKLKDLPHDSEFVFTMSTSGLWEGITRACDRAGIAHGYLHGLRHTNASVMEMLNIPATYANRRGGWANDHVRQTVYWDPMDEGANAAANQIDDYFIGLFVYGPPVPPDFVR